MSSRNPYRVEPPFYVSFSGGRTSGYLLRCVLDAWCGSLPAGGHVLFANTGREHAATYEFVERIGREWCPITWIEWADGGYRTATPETSDRTGAPFASLIAKRKYLPNPVARFCTADLKVKPMNRFMSERYEDFTTIIGLRSDEPERVSRLRADPTRDIAMPLADAGVTRDQVVDWWRSNPLDLSLPNDDPAFGNCDLCFLKGRSRIERVIAHDPSLADWWVRQEQSIGSRFRNDRPTYAQMLVQVTVQGRLFGDQDDHAIPCDCTE